MFFKEQVTSFTEDNKFNGNLKITIGENNYDLYQIYEAETTDYTAEGQGVAHIEGCAVFIPNAVAGEKVRVRVEKAQKTWAAWASPPMSG